MKKTFWFCLSLLFLSAAKATVCLNMIVKNEADVIEKCLSSVKPFIDSWVIVDTGSTDGTQEIIRNAMKNIPGELHERPWIDFAHNRNEALSLAKEKGDYLFFIDADEVIELAKDFSLPELTQDLYYIIVRQIDAADIRRIALVKSALDWEWKGVLHEVIQSKSAKTTAVLNGALNLCNTAKSARAKDPLTRLKDAQILVEALKKEPTNSRYAYYAAISYLAADQYELAQQYFQKRTEMASEDIQETYQALYHVGFVQEKRELFDAAIESYFKAYNYRPTRAEPLFHAAVLYRKKGNFLLGYLLSQFCLSIPCPSTDNCVEYPTYDYRILIEYANCALLTGRFHEGFKACCQLLEKTTLPLDLKERVASNREFARAQL